jgi:hypothetical protein
MSKRDCYAHSSWCWCGHDPCTGSSSSIHQEQCNAWQDAFDAANGNVWHNCSDIRLEAWFIAMAAALVVEPVGMVGGAAVVAIAVVAAAMAAALVVAVVNGLVRLVH